MICGNIKQYPMTVGFGMQNQQRVPSIPVPYYCDIDRYQPYLKSSLYARLILSGLDWTELHTISVYVWK
jgi:hypothetical protein